MAFTYILYSKTLDRYYIGRTEANIEDRLKKHLSNHKGFTGKAKDWALVYYEEYSDKHEAILREKQIKSWKSRKQVEILINPKNSTTDEIIGLCAGSVRPDAIGRVLGSNLSPEG